MAGRVTARELTTAPPGWTPWSWEARHLDLEVVCQGVEALEQLVAARAVGCPLGQGFLFSRPVGGDAVEALLAGSGPLPDVGLWEAASRRVSDAGDLTRPLSPPGEQPAAP